MSDLSLVNASRPVVKEGDWVCLESRCSNINAQGRTTCEACGKNKPRAKGKVGHEIGKDAAEKSKGLFSAEDWACSKCGNINWSRRSSCNICNAPKFGEVEARTGYGGGYMDRQEVEYVERAASDEEYDEFGRKKTKKRNFKNDSSDEDGSAALRKKVSRGAVENNPPAKIARADDDDEDEDDEEEDDDGDLSKYVLDDDAVVEDVQAKTKNGREAKGKVDQQAKCRSRSSSSRTRSTSGSSYSSYSTVEDGSSRSSSSASRSSGGGRARRKSRSGSRHRGRRENSTDGRPRPSRRHSRSESASRSKSRSRSRSKKRSRRSK